MHLRTMASGAERWELGLSCGSRRFEMIAAMRRVQRPNLLVSSPVGILRATRGCAAIWISRYR